MTPSEVSAQKISVVVPVYNEHDNIGACLRGLGAALGATPHEILVCYDFDEDTTLAAIAAMTDKPPTVRLVKNTIGRGAANALRAGFQAATGDVVVTTMADLSDPPEDILRMAEKMRSEHLAVVAGSRYMRGGSQTGGPVLKRTLSRLGGVSLHWIAGVGTHDATSNFRGYSKAFLDSVHIESRTGFQIALELTVKAHLEGRGVGEVPTTWTDRTAGESRFKLWRWLPSYLHWWWRAAWQPLIVGLVWLGMTIGACSYVAKYSARVPFWDDMELVPFIAPDYHWTAQEMWSQHNEHRLPLPRRIEAGLFGWSRDVRTLMFADVALLSGLALATLLVVRRIRGRTWLVDALFPMMWLHTGNAENLLMGFQIALVLPTVLVCALLMLAVTRARRGFTPLEAIFAGSCLLALPLCGGGGIVQAPALFAGLAIAAWWSWRSADPALRRGAAVLSVFLALTAALAVFYVIGLQYPEHASRTRDPLIIAASGLRTLTLVLGQAGKSWWPWSGFGFGILVAATFALLVSAWRRTRLERTSAHTASADSLRIVMIACVIVATVSLACSIGFGRAGGGVEAGFSVRYIPLVSPMVVALVCAWTLYGARLGKLAVPGTLAVALLAADVFVNARAGTDYGAFRQVEAAQIEADVQSGMEPRALAAKWVGRVYPDQRRLHEILGDLARLRIAPFDRAPVRVSQRYTWAISSLEPSRTEPPGKAVSWWVDNNWPAWLVPGGSALHFDVPAGKTRLTGTFGVLDAVVARGRPCDVRVRVSAGRSDGEAHDTLFERTIDPVHVAADRGPQTFDVELPPDRRHIVLEILALEMLAPGQSSPQDTQRDARWAYWGELDFH